MSVAVPTTSIYRFPDRALQLLAFLVERHGQRANMRHFEREVADWIDSWRRNEKRSADVHQHFAATELGIILRTLNGPSPTGARFEESSTQELCWVIARCLSQQA